MRPRIYRPQVTECALAPVDGDWPEAVADSLTLPCADCDQVPSFGFRVSDEFWRRWAQGPARLGVLCLPCLDKRCAGAGLAAAILEVQWHGSGHTVVLTPTLVVSHGPRGRES
jgi:hypothetical protein